MSIRSILTSFHQLSTPAKWVAIGVPVTVSIGVIACIAKRCFSTANSTSSVTASRVGTENSPLTSQSQAADQRYSEARRLYYINQNPAKCRQARDLLETLSSEGHIKSKILLAHLLDLGHGGPKNPQRARALFQAAADAGNARAMNDLGLFFEKGIGGPKDMSQARTLYKQAAQNEHPSRSAMINYGLTLLYGHGGPVDFPEARKWFKEAMNVGHVRGQCLLARMMVEGKGGEPGEQETDKAEGNRLIKELAENGYVRAMTYYGVILRDGDVGPVDLKGAREWFARAMNAGSQVSKYFLAQMMIEGKGAEPGEQETDKAEGNRLIKKLIEDGYKPAIEFTGKQIVSDTDAD